MARAGLEPGTAGLRVRRADHSATHVMNESTVADEFECHQKCLRNNSCKSFNVRPGADITKRLCELNNKTRKMTTESFKNMKGSSYYGPVKVSSTD